LQKVVDDPSCVNFCKSVLATLTWIIFSSLAAAQPEGVEQSSGEHRSGISKPGVPSLASDSNYEKLEIASFSKGDLVGWEEKSFKGQTRYQLKSDDEQGTVLHASSNGSASVFGKRVNIDLSRTPYLNWRWKIANRLEGIEETKKSGDDFAARIYIVKTSGLFGRKTKAVNYVWSSNQGIGTSWSNAYQPNNSKMLAVRGPEHEIGQWVTEKRNVAIDFERMFGKSIRSIDLVVIMSDTDNSGQSVSASYGDIYFSSQ